MTSGWKRRMTRNDVADDFVATPDALGVGVVFGEAEIEGAGKVLASAVEAAAGEELLGAGDTEFVAKFGSDDVLAAVAAGEGEVGGAVTLTAREPGEELGVFVVGVGGGVEDGAELAEVAELEEGLRDRRGGGGGRRRAVASAAKAATGVRAAKAKRSGGDSQVMVVESGNWADKRTGHGGRGKERPRRRASGHETRTGDYFSEAMSF